MGMDILSIVHGAAGPTLWHAHAQKCELVHSFAGAPCTVESGPKLVNFAGELWADIVKSSDRCWEIGLDWNMVKRPHISLSNR